MRSRHGPTAQHGNPPSVLRKLLLRSQPLLYELIDPLCAAVSCPGGVISFQLTARKPVSRLAVMPQEGVVG